MRFIILTIALLISAPTFARTELYCHNGLTDDAEKTLYSLEISLVFINKFGTYTQPEVQVIASVEDLTSNPKEPWVLSEKMDVVRGKDFITMSKNQKNKITFVFDVKWGGIVFNRTNMKIDDFEMPVTGIVDGQPIHHFVHCVDVSDAITDAGLL